MLPYSKQTIEQDDIDAVSQTLNSGWLTTGPKVREFENAFALATSSIHAVSVNSGTAALHCALHAAGVGPGDEVLVPAITFVATSNAAIYLGAKPIFVDVDPDTLLMDPQDVVAKVTSRTKVIVAVDYAGQPCDYHALRQIADANNLVLISDACHSLGGVLGEQRVGSLADFTCFSLHPIKQITAGEGGVVTTDCEKAAKKMREFRSHGVTTDFRQRSQMATHRYQMESLGFNYRLTDIQCALGLSQLKKLTRFTRRRNDVARFYDLLFESVPFVRPLASRPNTTSAYHLYVIKWDQHLTGLSRDEAFQQLREKGIGVNVHYQPVYQHPYYVDRFGQQQGCCPVAERVYEQILSLPIFVQITESDVRYVVETLELIGASEKRESIFKRVA